MSNHIINESELSATENSSFFGIITEDVLSSKNISNDAKLLYVKITMYANRQGFAWPSNKTLAEYFGVADRSIRRWLEELKENGFIHVELEKIGMRTDRKIYPILNSKNISTKDKNVRVERTKMSGSTGQKCPPNNIIRSNKIKNPPPPSSKPSPKKVIKKNPNSGKVSLRSEEEDSLSKKNKKMEESPLAKSLYEIGLTTKQISRISNDYHHGDVLDALEIFKTQEVKKDAMGLLLNILDYPDRWDKKQKIKTKEDVDREKEEYARKNKDLAIKASELYKNKVKIWGDFARFVYWDEKYDLFYWDENFQEIFKNHIRNLE